MGILSKTKSAIPSRVAEGANQPKLAGTPKGTMATDRMERIERLTHLLDESFKVPGTNFRIGWDSLIGLIPGLGDIATTALSGYLIYEARQAGASKWIIGRMIGNVGLDFLVGVIPLVGDAFDAFFKANRRNTKLLKKHLGSSAK